MQAKGFPNGPAAARYGFTLLELLTVMGIMVVLMSISGAAYYGMSRGAALRGAASNVRSTLSLARQFAATRRSNTYILLWQDATNAYYRTYVEAGVDAGTVPNQRLEIYGGGLFGEDASLIGGEIYKLSNLTATGYERGMVSNNYWDADLRMSVVITRVPTSQTLLIPWNPGDIAGWAIGSVGKLPGGVRYGNFEREEIVFKPDGTADLRSDLTITLVEQRGAGQRLVVVKAFTGLVR